RLQPPASLGADEVETWRRIVSSMPADWFGTCFFMLRVLVAHIANSETISAALADLRSRKDTPKRLQDLNRLTAMLNRETTAISSLSQKLRLAPRAKFTMERSASIKADVPAVRPWEIRKEDEGPAA